MKHFFLIAFILFNLVVQAQTSANAKLIGIHPAVGKTISQDEKIRYRLFPQYKDSTFESAQVFKLSDSTFLLAVKPITGSELKSPISIPELDELFYRIDEAEKNKKNVEEDYVLSKEERKEAERKRAGNENSEFWWNFLAQMTIITLETIIAIGLSN
jgi:hypothetical protein